MNFRPLSQRTNPDPSFDGPYEGLPSWLLESVLNWLDRLLYIDSGYKFPDDEFLRDAEVSLRLTSSFGWQKGGYSAVRSVRSLVRTDDEFALDFIDFALQRRCADIVGYAEALGEILTKGGSAWEVQIGIGSPRLVRRSVGPVAESLDAIRPVSQRAHAHLVLAWNKLMGRNPEPSTAYREAIRAVEVVAAPIVSPDDELATLGKIIKALKDKPHKWTVDLTEGTTGQVADMAAMIWRSQFDRHGTHDEKIPLNVSQEQADAAVHLAIALVRIFGGGHIARVA